MATRTERQAAGRRSKAKSKVFERTVASLFSEAGFTARRNFEQSGKHARSKSERLPDVTVDELFYLWIECSTGAKVSPTQKLWQAENDRIVVDKTSIPIAVTRKKGAKQILVTLYLTDLIDFLGRRGAISHQTGHIMSVEVSMNVADFIKLCRDP